jgi:hypothetical protein
VRFSRAASIDNMYGKRRILKSLQVNSKIGEFKVGIDRLFLEYDK